MPVGRDGRHTALACTHFPAIAPCTSPDFGLCDGVGVVFFKICICLAALDLNCSMWGFRCGHRLLPACVGSRAHGLCGLQDTGSLVEVRRFSRCRV